MEQVIQARKRVRAYDNTFVAHQKIKQKGVII